TSGRTESYLSLSSVMELMMGFVLTTFRALSNAPAFGESSDSGTSTASCAVLVSHSSLSGSSSTNVPAFRSMYIAPASACFLAISCTKEALRDSMAVLAALFVLFSLSPIIIIPVSIFRTLLFSGVYIIEYDRYHVFECFKERDRDLSHLRMRCG